MEDHARIQSLFRKYAANQHTQAELDELLRYFQLPEESDRLQALIDQQLAVQPAVDPDGQLVKAIADRVEDRVFGKLFPGTEAEEPPVHRLRRWLPYAAAAILLAVGWLLLVDSRESSVDSLAATEILPGGNRATLTLADGRVINLDEAQTGIIVGAEDVTYDDGSAVSPANSPHAGLTTYDLQLTTPKGGTYQITLPDGSKVWLNAASTLKYPSRFTGDVREVILEGEAFFAVSHRQSAVSKEPTTDRRQPTAGRMPFRVVTAGQTVEVLGTQFNISAYADEPETKTTLVEGEVKVTPGISLSGLQSSGHVLRPGEQATTRGTATTVTEVDASLYTAWKDGFFYFDGMTPQVALAQLSRWYDIEVVYQGKTPAIRFFGMIDKHGNLSDVLHILKESGIEFNLVQARDGLQLIIVGE